MKDNIENKLIRSAIEIFSTLPYDEVSVLQITSHAKVSNGVFYNYFSSKRDIFSALVNSLLDKHKIKFEVIDGANVEHRLKKFIELNYEVIENEYNLVRLFREAQYTFIEYELAIRDIYIKTLKKVYKCEISEYQYVIVMAAIRYTSIAYFRLNEKLDCEFLVRFILEGFNEKSQCDLNKIIEASDCFLKTPLTLSKKMQIVRKATELFGKMGYFNVKIEVIMKELGYSTGSFYHCFQNKEEVLKVILELFDSQIEEIVYENTFKYEDKFTNTLKMLYLIQSYFSITPEQYRIIRDAEFHFKTFSERYDRIKRLFMRVLETTSYSIEEKLLISCIMVGISHYAGIDMFYTKLIKNSDTLYKKVLKFLESGTKNKL
ncbi:MAG: TetR/AcrR family transcriptional regulator [Fusobacteria bacterium]|nr:TetR/AcrR family transcriptional regulator [Fusobacteriota bacterium]